MVPSLIPLGYRTIMAIPKLTVVKRASGRVVLWRKKAAVPGPSTTSACPEVTKTFRSVNATKLEGNIDTTIGRVSVLLFWALIVWVLLSSFLYFDVFAHLFEKAALVFPTELFVLKIILGSLIAAVMVNPFGVFTINVSPSTAVLVSNRVTRRLRVFGPGRHIKFPWEIKFHGPISLDVTRHPMNIWVVTRDRIDVIYQVNIE
jgi:hypothetical protein